MNYSVDLGMTRKKTIMETRKEWCYNYTKFDTIHTIIVIFH